MADYFYSILLYPATMADYFYLMILCPATSADYFNFILLYPAIVADYLYLKLNNYFNAYFVMITVIDWSLLDLY